MMNYFNRLLYALILFASFNSVYAANAVPNEFYIYSQGTKRDKLYNIENNSVKLGTVYRKILAKSVLDYEYFDSENNKLATVQSSFFYPEARFDVYDSNESVIGIMRQNYKFSSTFTIYDKDAVTKKTDAYCGFWFSTCTFYDPVTETELAVLYRPFLSFSWKFNITNETLFKQINLDSRVLVPLLALQDDEYYWPDPRKKRSIPSLINIQSKKLTLLAQHEGIKLQSYNPKLLAGLVQELELGYKNIYGLKFYQNNDAFVQSFTEYCFDIIQQNRTTQQKKSKILYLIKFRLDQLKGKEFLK